MKNVAKVGCVKVSRSNTWARIKYGEKVIHIGKLNYIRRIAREKYGLKVTWK